MIFEKITVENLFSYRLAEFDFNVPQPGCNVVLISGRNGYGKTSLLNSIKLLFVGVTEEMRASVRQGSRFSARDYVLGSGDDWLGILNYRARREGAKQFGITILWQERDERVEATRRWDPNNGSETLEIRLLSRGQAISGDDAQAFLADKLPPDYLPFFFFDGEQIQRLAEANLTKQQEHMERLLNIAPVQTLTEYINVAVREWRKEAMPEQARAQQRRLEAEAASLESDLASLYERRATLEWELAELEAKILEEDAWLESRRKQSHSHDFSLLEQERERLREEIEGLTMQIAGQLPVTAPLLANARLVAEAVNELRRLIDSEASQQATALQEILDGLPRDLFDKPPFPTPRLLPEQAQFYKKRLEGWIRTYIPAPDSLSDGLMRLELPRARELLSVLDYFAQAGAEREQRARELRDVARKRRRVEEVTAHLDDLSGQPEEEQREYLRRKALGDEHKERRGAIRHELELLAERERQLGQRLEEKRREMRRQERAIALSEQTGRKVELAERTERFFREYKHELKRRKRALIEQRLNEHFKTLMTSHTLVDFIGVDEHFGKHFLDADRNSIGMASISAGMKQIAATSLLWALKDVTGKEIPVVIDTPLARIDLEHQIKLLTHYYPNASEQVIVLPTDSELDERKYRTLLPHVYREFRLENPQGNETRVESVPMYPAVEGAAHG